MAFWGLEVQSGEVAAVKIDEGMYVQLTQATLDAKTEESGLVHVHIIVDGKKVLFASLDPEFRTALLNVALVKDVQISHTLTDGSIYLFGLLDRQGLLPEG